MHRRLGPKGAQRRVGTEQEGRQLGVIPRRRVHGVEPGQLPTTGALNARGYRYLGANLPERARVIFELNVAAHPDYANGFDSLAECCVALGEPSRQW